MNFLKTLLGIQNEPTVKTTVVEKEVSKEFNIFDYLDENEEFSWKENIIPIKKVVMEETYEEIVKDRIKVKVKKVVYKSRRESSHNYTSENFNVSINKHGITVWDNKNEYLRLYKMPVPKTKEEADCIFSKLN